MFEYHGIIFQKDNFSFPFLQFFWSSGNRYFRNFALGKLIYLYFAASKKNIWNTVN